MIAGQVLQRRHTHVNALAARARHLEAEHEAEVAAALEAERGRLARELHDVVAHCVTVMVVQAGVAEALLDRSPERARDPLQAVQDTGRQAIAELTRMLGLLRSAPAAAAHPLEPQAGAARIPELLAGFTTSGLRVQLEAVGDVRALPPGVDLTTYRIVQEALTNTLKHAGPGARARVVLRYQPRSIEIEIADDGSRTATSAPVGAGHGLIGMKERVSVFGGSLQAAPRSEGGFRVLVDLPAEPA